MPTLFELYIWARDLLSECERYLMMALGPSITYLFFTARGELVYWTAEYECARWPHVNVDGLWMRLFLACQAALDAFDSARDAGLEAA